MAPGFDGPADLYYVLRRDAPAVARFGVAPLARAADNERIVATQRFLGFDAQFGWSDEKWLNTLAGALSVMKKAGLK